MAERNLNDMLDTTFEGYRKQLDALFANQALDIETDIVVLESMMKREVLPAKTIRKEEKICLITPAVLPQP